MFKTKMKPPKDFKCPKCKKYVWYLIRKGKGVYLCEKCVTNKKRI